MALTRIGTELDFLNNATGGVISVTKSRKYSSEVEVLNSAGGLADVIYSGEETTETTTAIADTMADLTATGSSVNIRSRVEFSNEDVAKTTTESLTFDF
jgi:hypothetical protein